MNIKSRENRARRHAAERGLMLVKSRAVETSGEYVLVDDCAGNRGGLGRRRGGQRAASDFANGEGTDLAGIEEELANLR